MKKYFILSILFLFFAFSGVVIAQGPPPPPPELPGQGQMNGGKGQGGNKGPGESGGAPIGGGLEVLIFMGAAYGIRKWWHQPSKIEE